MVHTDFNVRNNFQLAIAFSVIFHLVFLLTIKTQSEIIIPTRMTIRFVEPTQSKPSKQIVSPSDIQNNLIPEKQSYLSDTNNQVEKEMLKRGDAGGIPGERAPEKAVPEIKEVPKKEASKKETEKKEIEKKEVPQKRQELKLSDQGLLAKYSTNSQANKKQNQDSDQQELSQQPREFSRATGTGAAFFGTSGVPDYLPQLPDGDLTLLNTKASQHAVFVRRVASRVFGEMRQSGWDYLLAQDIYRIKEMVTVEAVLDLAGKIISIKITDGSGSSKFDEILLAAAKKGAEDKNPPPSAVAEDGNIHFIFKSRSWTRPAMSRSGQPTEQRWLLLGTGLK